MKTNNSTKMILNTSISGISTPGFSVGRVLLVLITLLVFSILVKLGFWQLDRAAEKQALQTALSQRQQAAPLSYTRLQHLAATSPVTGYRLSVTVTPTDTPIILLDNQVFEGQVGYLAYQVMRVDDTATALLVELGFVKGSQDRGRLPKVTSITTPSHLSGKLYQKSTNPMSHKLYAEAGDPIRIQNLNLNKLSNRLGLPLINTVLQPEQVPGSRLPHPWQPIPLSAQKHHGYALQWFSMAGAFLLLNIYLLILKRKNKETVK